MKYVSKCFNCASVTRGLIGLLFVVAGVQKLYGFYVMHASGMGFSEYAGRLLAPFSFIPSGFLPVLLVLVLIIEIPVALMYISGCKYVKAGWILIGFTVLTIIFYHNPWMGNYFSQMNLLMALKNIAIIGGILSTLGCYCGKCMNMCKGGVCKVESHAHHHNHTH